MLNISENNRNLLVSELRLVASLMQEAKEPSRKLYFFSATWAMIQRVFNIEYHPELVFSFQVLNLANNQLAAAINPPLQELSSIVLLKVFTELEGILGEMALRWEQGKEITDLLERIAELAYASTGNGVYLIVKGAIKSKEQSDS